MNYATIELLEGLNELTEADRGALAEYLGGYHEPTFIGSEDTRITITCVGCDKNLHHGDPVFNMLFGSTFEWGIANGEGACSHCGWQYRMYHSVKLSRETPYHFTVPLAHRLFKADDRDVEVDPADRLKEAAG